MIIALRLLFAVVLASMLAVTTWASAQVPLWAIPRAVGAHPWFLATLADTYWAFLMFYLWLAWREPSALARALWFLAIVLLGNIAMASYGLAVTLRTPAGAPVAAVVERGRPVSPLLPVALLAGGAIVAAWAALR